MEIHCCKENFQVIEENLYKYCKYYSGQEPKFIEDDIFKIIVSLNEAFSYDFEVDALESAVKLCEGAVAAEKSAVKTTNKSLEQQNLVLQYVANKGKITTKEAAMLLLVKERRARAILMVDKSRYIAKTRRK